jgi:RNA polymerase sigma-70 factor
MAFEGASDRIGVPDSGSFELGIQEEELLRRLFDSGMKEYGPLALEFPVFAREALRRVRDEGAPGQRAPLREHELGLLRRAAGSDLFLAIACDQDVPGAWDTLVRRYLPRLRGLALRSGSPAADVEDLLAELCAELVTPRKSGPARTRLGTFRGEGSLFGWLAAILLRRLVVRRRSLRTEPQGGGGPENPAPAAPAADPSDRVLDAEAEERLDRALKRAWRDLTSQQAMVLRCKYRLGLPQKEIARLLGVGEPWVSRILKQAVGQIRASVWREWTGEETFGATAERHWMALANAVRNHMERPSGETERPIA